MVTSSPLFGRGFSVRKTCCPHSTIPFFYALCILTVEDYRPDFSFFLMDSFLLNFFLSPLPEKKKLILNTKDLLQGYHKIAKIKLYYTIIICVEFIILSNLDIHSYIIVKIYFNIMFQIITLKYFVTNILLLIGTYKLI